MTSALTYLVYHTAGVASTCHMQPPALWKAAEVLLLHVERCGEM